jgi:hypothetical protein
MLFACFLFEFTHFFRHTIHWLKVISAIFSSESFRASMWIKTEIKVIFSTIFLQLLLLVVALKEGA